MKIYIILYHHKHGVDAWPEFAESAPDGGDIIDKLRAQDEWDEDDDERGSYIDVTGPFEMPKKDES